MQIIKDNNIILKNNDLTAYGLFEEFLNGCNIDCEVFEGLHAIIDTMNGDAKTPFNTIRELIEYIPEIIDCTAETCILCLYDDELKYFVLDWNFEDDIQGLNKALQTIGNYTLVK